MNKQQIRARQRAREMAVQALYQRFVADQPMIEVEAQFLAIIKRDKVDEAYFCELIQGVEQHLDEIDTSFEPYLDREITALNPVEKAILRLSTYELIYCPAVPFRIVLEEAVLLAKTFGAQDGFRYVNGVLNQLAGKVRAIEKTAIAK